MEKAAMGGGGSERVQKLRERMLTAPEICIERGYLITESYKETESNPAVIRRAKALEKVLKEMTISIEEGELLVGKTTSKVRGGALVPEVRADWYLEEMDTISTRDWDRFAPLTREEKAKMREFLPYWKGRSLYDKWCARIPEDMRRLNHKVKAGGAFCENDMFFGHIGIEGKLLLSKGLNGIQKEIDEELAKLNLAEVKDFEKYQFLSAVHIVLEAAVGFAKRYAELATSLAEKENDVTRKAELQRIAEVCSGVPASPAQSFYEAMQSILFIYTILMIEGWSNSIGFGRPDQYLYSFYKKDIEEKRITKEEARELISLLFIKMNASVLPHPTQMARIFAGLSMSPNLTLGGLTEEGKDAVNELSYLFLDAEEEVRLPQEDLVIRVHKNTPDAFLIRACEVAQLLRGKLKFISDGTIIQQLLTMGMPLEYARDYIMTGCFTSVIPGRTHNLPGGMFNLPLMMELALNNGASRLTGEQIGPKTGDPRKFKSYDEVWNAYKKHVEALMPVGHLFKNVDKQLFAEFLPSPFQSAFYRSCIEKGLDITNGGTAPYIAHGTCLSGAPNVGDSLAAIKKIVFEDKKITMERLIDALDKNFEGDGEMLRILASAPKFGNDDDYVDSIVDEVLAHASYEITKIKGIKGAISNAAAATVTANVPLGQEVGALPDGRRAGEPIAEGGISPHQGRNVSGPTATMKSVAKLDQIKLTNGSVLNMRFNPDVLKDDSKIRKFASLVRTFCESGGFLVQFNIVNADTLRDAQSYPENYRDLLVRVATYSAYFVELSKELQDNIIARMEFQEV
jgi:pyruvate formate-lyase/glycerol dehydratase family glycyl radical enzyme